MTDTAPHADIRAREAAATPGPWWNDSHEIYASEHVDNPAISTWIAETCNIDLPDRGDANAAFLAHARQDVPLLLAELDLLRADRDFWRHRYYDESRTCWDASLPPGGECCADCGQPVESEPCPEHHPATVAERLRAELAQARQQIADGIRAYCPDHGTADTCRIACHCAIANELTATPSA